MLGNLLTEQRNPASAAIDTLPTGEMLRVINREDEGIAAVVGAAIPQIALAVDRISEKIAYLYNPLNLSVLRFLRQIVTSAAATSTQLSICGEMAGEPQYTMLLLGLGFRHLSMSPVYMYQVKKIVRSVSIKECEELVLSILGLENTEDIEKTVRKKFKEKFYELSQ
jgi:phosphotransferase system enzyme I (PtsI)